MAEATIRIDPANTMPGSLPAAAQAKPITAQTATEALPSVQACNSSRFTDAVMLPILGFEAPCDERPIPTLTRIKSGAGSCGEPPLSTANALPWPRRSRGAGLGRYGVDFARDAAMICGNRAVTPRAKGRLACSYR